MFRMKAIEVLENAVRGGKQIAEDPNVQNTMKVDLYRRTGQFEKAEHLAASLLENKLEDILRSILVYERWLIARGDDAVHNVQEANDHESGRSSS